MRVTVTGATGLLGSLVVRALVDRGDTVTVLSRDAQRAEEKFAGGVTALEWKDPAGEQPPAAAIAGADGIVNLLGEPVAQRWTDAVKRELRSSRIDTTRNLVAAIKAADPRPRVLVSGSAAGWYGARGDEALDETAPHADDFLAELVAGWEREAFAAEE